MENENKIVPVEFFSKVVLDTKSSQEKGNRVYTNNVYIRHYISKLSVFEREIREEDKIRYPREYAHFNRLEQQKKEGTLIDMLPIDGVDIEELKENNIFTIEQLINLVLTRDIRLIFGDKIDELQNTAKAFMQQSTKEKVELEEARNEIARLKKQIEELQNVNIKHNNGGSGQNTIVRETTNNNRKQQQRNKAIASIS